jgi:hypothetical protein
MPIRADNRKSLVRVIAFGFHTLAVYACALFFSPWLVGRWFAWIAPVLHVSGSNSPRDWYLQHLELMSIVPALMAGYFNARRASLATWAWIGPTIVLIYEIWQHWVTSSVLLRSPVETFTYFFHIQHRMPMLGNPTASDPVRVLNQMTITAPFYAGIAYSVGALFFKLDLIHTLFSFERAQASDTASPRTDSTTQP